MEISKKRRGNDANRLGRLLFQTNMNIFALFKILHLFGPDELAALMESKGFEAQGCKGEFAIFPYLGG